MDDEYRRGFDAGHTAGVGYAIKLLMDARVPIYDHNPLHVYLDKVLGANDPKREPRARANWPGGSSSQHPSFYA